MENKDIHFFKLVWNNLNEFKIGKSIIKMEVSLKKNLDAFSLAVDNGIERREFSLAVNSKNIFDKLEKLTLPTENYIDDESIKKSYTIFFDDVQMDCYLSSLKLLNQIKEIINFENIYRFALEKAQIC